MCSIAYRCYLGTEHYFGDGFTVPQSAVNRIKNSTYEELRSFYPKAVVEKILWTNIRRDEELESRKFMSSLPRFKHSYGKFQFFKKRVERKYDRMLATIIFNHTEED